MTPCSGLGQLDAREYNLPRIRNYKYGACLRSDFGIRVKDVLLKKTENVKLY